MEKIRCQVMLDADIYEYCIIERSRFAASNVSQSINRLLKEHQYLANCARKAERQAALTQKEETYKEVREKQIQKLK